MNRRLCLSLILLMGSAACAQAASPFTLYVHDTTGTLPDTPLPSIYSLASTAVGGSSPTVIKMVNTSANDVYFATALVSTSATSSTTNTNFSVTGVFDDQLLVPGASVLYTINFAPTTTGVITGYLNLAYQVQTGGCVFSGSGTVCPANLTSASTLTGNASTPVLTLSYQSGTNSVVLTPSSSSPLNYPNTSLSSTSTINFTLSNSSAVSVTVPAITLAVLNSNEPSAFAINTSNVPPAIAAGGSANFTITFAPSQAGLASGALQIGSNTYPIQGYGVVIATVDVLQISYTNSTGVRTLPQSATPISFGSVVPGSGASAVLTFNISNPSTSANAVAVSTIAIAGTSYSVGGLPSMPVSIAPGNSINFTLAFTPVAVGTFTGGLAIGARTFSLTGVSISSTVPSFSITISGPMSSQQQLNLVIQLSAPSPVATIGTITMSFAPAVSNVTDDAAIVFLATGGRQLNVALAAGAQTATYNGQASIAFQTGTTAGSITFTVAFPNTAIYKQSFAITGGTPLFTSVQATPESPNLIVTVNGYDNTYSAGQLSFTFYDTSGKVIGSPIAFNATADFQQLFFVGNTYGGLFSLQGDFPISGDITKIGSVTVSLANSAGTTSQSASLQ